MQIIGLGHYSRTGKDTLAGMIRERQPGVKIQPFAKRLKQLCYALFSQHGLQPPDYYDHKLYEHERTEVIPSLEKSPVELWIAVGNAMRDVYAPVWIESAFNAVSSDVAAGFCSTIIIPDVRFPNEVDAIRERGGWLVKVVRAGYGPKDTVSDRALLGFDGWDYVAGPTLEALKHDADYLAECVRTGTRPTQSAAMRAVILEQENLAGAKAA